MEFIGNENEANNRFQGTLHKVSGPLTRDVRRKNMKLIAAILWLVTVTAAFAYTNAPPGTIDDRLNTIIIPSCEFRDGNAADVLEFMISGIIMIPEAKDMRSIGLIDTNAPPIPHPVILDRSLPACSNLPSLTLNMRRITMRKALDYVTTTLNLRYTVTATNILVYTADGILLNKQ